VIDIPEGVTNLPDIATALRDHIDVSLTENLGGDFEYDVSVEYQENGYEVSVSKYEDAQKKLDRLKSEEY